MNDNFFRGGGVDVETKRPSSFDSLDVISWCSGILIAARNISKDCFADFYREIIIPLGNSKY